MARVIRIWPTAVAGEADSVSSVSPIPRQVFGSENLSKIQEQGPGENILANLPALDCKILQIFGQIHKVIKVNDFSKVNLKEFVSNTLSY